MPYFFRSWVLLWYGLYFFGLRRLNWTKKEPPRVFFGVFKLSKCENTSWACTSLGSLNPWISDIIKHYFPFSSSLLKNEVGSELTFLDSLKFNRAGKEEVSLVFSSGSMSSLNIALFVFFDTHVSVITFHSTITLSFLLFLLFVIPGESNHVFYMTNKFRCSIYKLQAALGHLCVMLIVQGLNPMFDLYLDPIIVISVISCVSLHLPSS